MAEECPFSPVVYGAIDIMWGDGYVRNDLCTKNEVLSMQYHSSLLLLCNSLSLVLWGFYSAYVVQEGLISLPPALGPKRWMFGLELMDQDPLSSQLQLLAPR